MDSRRILFWAACLALIVSAFSFAVRTDVNDSWRNDFQLTGELVGTALGAAFVGMAVSMLLGSPLAEFTGLGPIMFLGWLCHLAGILCTIFAHELVDVSFVASIAGSVGSVADSLFVPIGLMEQEVGAGPEGFWILWLGTFLVGCGNGLTEVWINPLAATLYPDQKTHKMNVLHAWFPGGIIVASLLASQVINRVVGYSADTDDPDIIRQSWQIKMAMLGVPLLLYGVMCLGRTFPRTERVQMNVPVGVTFLQLLRPLFILLGICMLLTASSELGPQNWQNAVLTRTAGVNGTVILAYTAGLMFVLRFFSNHITALMSPIVMMLLMAVMTSGGLFLLSYADNGFTAFLAATVFGIGIAYFWPTMLGVTAERFPRGGALLIGLMGCVGNLAIAYVLPQIGKVYDSSTVANLPAKYHSEPVPGVEKGELVTEGERLDPAIPEGDAAAESAEAESFVDKAREFFYPGGDSKLNPQLTDTRKKELPEEVQDAVTEAEKQGAAFAFRRVAVLPGVLVVLFGLFALVDVIRGGYRRQVEREVEAGGVSGSAH